MALNTAEILAKWKRNAGAAGEALKSGVSKVTESPTAKAAQKVGKYLANVTNAVNSGRYAASLQAVSLEDWRSAMNGKGIQNYTNGVSNISPRAAKAMADQQTFAAQVSAQVSSMPSETDNDMEQRALAAIRMMRDYKKG